jgi:inner membrane protein
MHVVWWHWICLGLLLMLAEATAAGGFYLLFVGIAALLVGAITLVVPTVWVQITLFAVLSAGLIATLRKPLVERVRKTTRQADTPEFIGETARAVEPISAGKEGRVELRGSTWQARNSGSADLAQGAACTIVAREGIKMVVTQK